MANTDRLIPPMERELLGWSRLAVAALAVAGLLAFGLALPRFPGVKDFLSGDFFYRTLITHVVFSVVVWYLAVTGALTVYATAKVARSLPGGEPPFQSLGQIAKWMGVISFFLILIPYVGIMGHPLINNYVPTLTHPMFQGGLAVLAVAVAILVKRLLLTIARAGKVDAQSFGMGAAGLIYLVALACFLIAWLQLPFDLDEATYNERLFWGGGHMLQFVYATVAMVAWYILARIVVGEGQISDGLFKVMTGSLAVFALPSLGIYAVFDVLSFENREAFTQMLWFGVSMPPAIMLVSSFVQLWRKRADIAWKEPLAIGYTLSLTLFAVGGVLGYFLGVSDTRTPSHYHAVIGGVNLALMCVYFGLILPVLGRDGFRKKTVRLLLTIYGVGQLIQIIGLYWAGAAGVPRKTAGAAQGLDSIEKKIAMGIQGSGGGIAIIGGIIFVWVVISLLLKKRVSHE